MSKKFMSMDGNTAAAHVSYMFTDVAGIYPITPSSTMAELVDEWASQGRKNIFNSVVNVVQLQSEGGAAATVHGALQAGSLSTTYTASQGLLLMIPNMYKWVGEMLPAVMHVSARSIATRALSIFGDHQDIYATRQTGVTMLSSHSVQESMDLAGVAHLAAIKASTPVLHFFDGFRTSHEIQKIEVMEQKDLEPLLDREAVKRFRDRALNPHGNAVTRGGAENDDIYFQGREAQNNHHNNIVEVVAEYMEKISDITGRHYAPFTYYGAEDAERIVVAMGSVTETTHEVVDELNRRGEKVGMVKVHLYRPFSAKYLKAVIPDSVKKVAVLDRTKEQGANEPLYLDVKAELAGYKNIDTIVGGRYGLSSKDTQPRDIKAVYDHLNTEDPHTSFTISINDDVTHLSLKSDPDFKIEHDYTSCLFYGLGSDGTVSANKNSIKIIGNNTDLQSQAYFAYDSKKAGGATRSHLRFGPSTIRSTYYVDQADFISCSLDSYLFKYDMLRYLKDGGTFLLSTTFSGDELKNHLPNKVKKQLAEKNVNFYVINAVELAQTIGMGRRTNTILQSSFFALNPNIMDYDEAIKRMKEAAAISYGKKGEEIVNANYRAIDLGKEGLVKVSVDPEWKDLEVNKKAKTGDDYFDNFVSEINSLQGYDLPVSAFIEQDVLDGSIKNSVAFEEHRQIATQVPKWIPENCIQCGFCSFVCPHATIRTFLLTKEELENAPAEFVETIKPMGKGTEDLYYRVQVSPDNCVGCGLCATECPGKGGEKALVMVDVNEQIHEAPLANYLYKETEYKEDIFSTDTIKGSQLLKPYFEVSGACAGCGETPYYRLASQLFGRDMLIANATGCSSIYSASTPSSPCVVDNNNEGIAWANSLFEDNAEYGFGMKVAQETRAQKIVDILTASLDEVEPALKEVIEKYLEVKGDRIEERFLTKDLVKLVQESKSEKVKEVLEFEKDLISKSVWIIGGDGWAYDIGYGGLDHVLANNLNLNVLVLDTEVYSNTGGQSSKASQAASIAKFAASGKEVAKKNLGQMMMVYGHVYVASVSMGANRMQTIKAMKEAEAYDGPSIVIAYSPCIEHGIKGGLTNHQKRQKAAVASGYWTLYRYNPELETPLVIDSPKPDFDKFPDFLMQERRFAQLPNVNEDNYQQLFEKSKLDAEKRYNRLVKLVNL